MTVASRRTARIALADLLETVLVGDGLPAQAVYSYRVGDFQGASPVVVVTSGPAERRRANFGAEYRTIVTLYVYVFVVYSAPGWTEEDAENAIDDIECRLADALLTSTRHEPYWTQITYGAPTRHASVSIGGVEYRQEVFTLTVEVL